MTSPTVKHLLKGLRDRLFSYLPDKWHLVPLACIIGLIMSVVTLVFYKTLMWLTGYVFSLPRYAMLFFPATGAFISALMIYRYAPEAEGHGIDGVAKAFHQQDGRVTLRVSLIKALSSIFTLGFGGSGGVEGPIAQIGAGVGSSLARLLRCSVRDVRAMMLSGSAAGIGAIFKAPLGGAFASVEVVYREDIEASALVPAVFAAITSFLVYSIYMPGEKVLMMPESMLMKLGELPAYILLAGLCVVFGFVFVRLFHKTREVTSRLRIPNYFKPLLGGLVVGLIGYYCPMALGARFKPLLSIAVDDYALRFLFVLLLLKILTTCLTVGTGGSGGVFGPSLFIGGLLGALLYKVLTLLPLPFHVPPNASLVVVGMAAFFSCVAKAPIGALLMACEMTGSFELIVPLLFVNVLVVIASKSFGIYVNQVEDRFHSPIYMKGIPAFILRRTSITELFKRREDFEDLRILKTDQPASMLGDLYDHPHVVFPLPVADAADRITGILTMKKINAIRQRPDLQSLTIGEIMYPAVCFYPDDSMLKVIAAFKKHVFSRFPVVDRETGKLIGLIQYQDIFGNIDETTDELGDSIQK
ncbi:MAG: CBS domain-containing protein [Spartobacteria bacterium]|nr:CBS domain-containing protein [Spartobacteria bacterium]